MIDCACCGWVFNDDDRPDPEDDGLCIVCTELGCWPGGPHRE